MNAGIAIAPATAKAEVADGDEYAGVDDRLGIRQW